jgi:hypothetical protein
MIVRPTRRAHRAAALLGSALSILPSPLWAERDRPGLLWGGGVSAAQQQVFIDPSLPTGAAVQSQPRPRHLPRQVCSWRQPVCIHHPTQLPEDLSAAYLLALEDAYARLVGALGLPAPLSDPGLGPSAGLDLYLLPDGPSELSVVPDPRMRLDDRTSAHCRVRPSREQHRWQATSCVAEALLLGLDAGETPQLRRSIAAYLSQTVEGTSNADLDSIDTLQNNPQLGIAGRELSSESAGAALFMHYLDRRLAAGRRGSLPVALVQLSRGESAAGQPAWNNEPDAFDVLRQAFHGSSESFDTFMLSFAVQRAFLGSRDNGHTAPELLWLGDAGRVRFDWVLKASSLPRRVAPLRPIEPLGASYIWLDLDRITLGASLGFRANWEAPVSFRWTLATVDADGNLLKRYDLPYVQNATSAERSIEDYAGASAVLIVGTNLGGVDLAHPFDPDFEPFEPHGFTVYLAEL